MRGARDWKSHGSEQSYSDFQLNMVRGGVGDVAFRHGIDPRNPKNWFESAKFAMDYMKAHGTKPWTGAHGHPWPDYHAPPPATPTTSGHQGHVMLDGHKVGRVMFARLGHDASGPSHGSQTPDGSRGSYGPAGAFNVSFA